MSNDKGLKPGEKAPKSGQYQKGEPMPPTDKKGTTFDLVDPTKNKSGKGK